MESVDKVLACIIDKKVTKKMNKRLCNPFTKAEILTTLDELSGEDCFKPMFLELIGIQFVRIYVKLFKKYLIYAMLQ